MRRFLIIDASELQVVFHAATNAKLVHVKDPGSPLGWLQCLGGKSSRSADQVSQFNQQTVVEKKGVNRVDVGLPDEWTGLLYPSYPPGGLHLMHAWI